MTQYSKMCESDGFAIGGISLSVNDDAENACEIAANELRRAGINPARLRLSIYRRSIDARKKNDIRIVYSVAVRPSDVISRFDTCALSRIKRQVTLLSGDGIELRFGSQKSEHRPLVVGMGPAGMFCALMLAENGYRPIIVDRGDSISERVGKAKAFSDKGELDTESNIQFGAGGAGTFSDGKLLTRVNDPRVNYVLRRFCDFGAPEDIMINAKPHIGTDLLVGIVDKLLARIEELGGEVIYRCRLDGIGRLSDGSVLAKMSDRDIVCSCAVLAIGHSSRDTYDYLIRNSFAVEPKPFSVGVRIEHLQSMIDTALYGDFAGHANLGRAEYHLSDTSSGRGVYTFCMCPGGEVVAAASEECGVVVNGMSRHARDGRNANSAILVTVRPEDYGSDCVAAINFQRSLEKRAFEVAGGDYYAPCQVARDFIAGTHGVTDCAVEPTYRSGRVRETRLDLLLPAFVAEEMRRGLMSFDKKIQGFAGKDAILTGVETRSSSPVRILRTDALCCVGNDGIYPCGEGAGYAGGITSAAIDGLRVAQAIMERFAKTECFD